ITTPAVFCRPDFVTVNAIRDSRIAASYSSRAPGLVCAIIGSEPVSEINCSHTPLPGGIPVQLQPLTRLADRPVRISHPLAAIYTLIHPNRSQHSQPRFWRRTAHLLYLHAEWTRRPSN